jgi:hypothetical protein
MWKYYGSYIRETPDPNAAGDWRQQEVQYSYYEGSLYGSPGRGKTQSVSFSLGNNLEMKLRNDNDTTGKKPYTVVSLIDNFALNTSYNFAADSMRLSNIGANLRIKFGTFYTLNLSTNFDPYAYALDEPTTQYKKGRPVRVNKFVWADGKFPRWSGVGTSLSYTLNNDTFKKLFGKDKKSQNEQNENENAEGANQNNQNANDLNDNENSTAEYDTNGYEKVDVPWSIGLNYTFGYGPSNQPEDFLYDKMRYKNIINVSNLNLSFNISLGKNWNGSTSVYYDLKAKKFTASTFTVRRNLHCWSMSASFVPFGPYKSYNFHIGVNSSMLQDLKYDRQTQNRVSIKWF